MSAWLVKCILRQSKKPSAFAVNPKYLLITHADMEVRAPNEEIIFSNEGGTLNSFSFNYSTAILHVAYLPNSRISCMNITVHI
jgi:hypothetical protein